MVMRFNTCKDDVEKHAWVFVTSAHFGYGSLVCYKWYCGIESMRVHPGHRNELRNRKEMQAPGKRREKKCFIPSSVEKQANIDKKIAHVQTGV